MKTQQAGGQISEEKMKTQQKAWFEGKLCKPQQEQMCMVLKEKNEKLQQRAWS